jgi:ribosome-associated protein
MAESCCSSPYPTDELWRGGNVLESIELARKMVDVLADKKASDILLLDVREVSLLADFFLITTGQVDRQIEAMASDLSRAMKEDGVLPLHVEGEPSSGWVLMDYGDVIIHLFSPMMRAYYRLEEFWKEAKVVVRMQ